MKTPLIQTNQEPQVLIIDCRSQYTHLIARILREINIRSVVLNPSQAGKWAAAHSATLKAAIISGGAPSIHDEDAPQLPQEVLDLTIDSNKPIPMFCICYGMQWVANHLGGLVENIPEQREYGLTSVIMTDNDRSIFKDVPETVPATMAIAVWSSHGDSVTVAPDGFAVTAMSGSGCIAAMEDEERKIYCVQFHPEVKDTTDGEKIFSNFIYNIACCQPDWYPENTIGLIQQEVAQALGENKAIIGFSGGVDSTTLSAILAKQLGGNLLAVTIDGGHLRRGELDFILEHAAKAKVALKVIDARALFEKAFAETTDAKEKRLIFKSIYVQILKEEAEKFGAQFIIQGTLATDLIESGSTGGAEIKNHHNANLSFGELKQLHPLRELFKYEVRALAEELKLPESIWNRKPFPGPGLFIRIFGTPVTQELLNALCWADATVETILRKHGVFDGISQVVVAYDGSKTVCVKGDGRAHVGSVVVRGVKTQDFMTAEGVFFPEPVVRELCSELTKHRLIGRVFIDSTSKPPATTEYE